MAFKYTFENETITGRTDQSSFLAADSIDHRYKQKYSILS